MGMPFLSVVIANYNYGRFIESAIRSVFEQDCFENCELIVVDGKSTDDSVSVIRRYADKLAWWCSEEDNGQSAAFNKGFRHAKGRFLTRLNADDIMMPNAVKKLRDAAASNPNGNNMAGLGVGLGAGVATAGVLSQALANAKDSPVVKPAEDKDNSSSELIECPNCHAQVKKGSKFCPECGNKLPSKRFCTNCGAELSSNAKFCPECGTKQ